MSDQAKARAVEQIMERVMNLQELESDLNAMNMNLKKSLPDYTRKEAIEAIGRRMADNAEIIVDTKKDIDALLKVIDILSN